MAELQAGQLIGARYRTESLLGCGGMAAVFRAHHLVTEKVCALKVVHRELAQQPHLVALFNQEAKLGAKIGTHPHIVDVFDAGVDESSARPFLAMELLVGETLEARLLRGPLARTDTLRLLDQLCDALTHAHASGVVHRDLKPSNLFVLSGAPSRLKLMDFGIAKTVDAPLARGVTQIGTPGYAAPEQLGPLFQTIAARQGVRIATQITAATDVWGVALLAYEMLTGQTGWQYWDIECTSELAQRLLEKSPLPSQRAGQRADLLPAGFDGWFARATKKDAAERFDTVEQAQQALRPLLATAPLGSPHPAAAIPSKTVNDEVVADTLPPISERRPPVRVSVSPTLPMGLHDAVVRGPLDPARHQALYTSLAHDADRRARVAQVLVHLGAADEEQRALADASAARTHIRPQRALTPTHVDSLLRHPNEGPITSALLGSVSRALLASLKQIDGAVLDDSARRRRLDDGSDVSKSFAWAARIFSLSVPTIYAVEAQSALWRLTAEHPPNLKVSDSLASRSHPRELAFIAGQSVIATAPERMSRWMLGDAALLKDALAAAICIMEPRISASASKRVYPIARAIQKQLSVGELQALREAYLRFVDSGGRTHLGMWAHGAEHTAARAGLLLCDDLAIAYATLKRNRAARRQELMADLIAFFTSAAYRQLRSALGLAPPS